ncbi:methionine synthase II [Klebsiella pneumoniae]|nr:methionine synthase II [Klebsiella pneumoniae]
MQRQQAPFRADIVGSFLRPDSIKQARQQLAEGIIDAAQLREMRITRSVIWFSSNATAACMWSPTVSFVAHGGISILRWPAGR